MKKKKTLLVKFKDQNRILFKKKKYKYLEKKNTKLKYFDHPLKKKKDWIPWFDNHKNLDSTNIRIMLHPQ